MRRRNWGFQQPPVGSRQNPSHPLSQGLIGHWLLNEHGGLIAYDISPSQRHGTLTNGPAWTDQRPRAVVSFDGSNDYISVPSGASDIYSFASDTSTFTLSAWVRFNVFSSGRTIMAKWLGTGNQRAWLFHVLSGDLRMNFSNDGVGIGWQVQATNACVLDVWQHCVVTFDNNNDAVLMYVNGKDVAASTVAGSPLVPLNSTSTLNFGASKDGTDDQLNGYLSDLRIYNRVLSSQEVAWLYREPYADIVSPRLVSVKSATAADILMGQAML